MTFPNASLFPETAAVNSAGRLEIGGCDTADLAAEFGTPLYLFDEDTLRGMCREFVGEFTRRYDNTRVAYASKAFLNPAIAKVIKDEGLALDVVSGGELAVAEAVGFPPGLLPRQQQDSGRASHGTRLRHRPHRHRWLL